MGTLAVVGWAGAVVWWLGLAAVVFVVVPVVLVVARGIIRSLVEIRRYSDDILQHAGMLGTSLDAVSELDRTRQLSATVARGFDDVAAGLARVLDDGSTR